mgnify:CR=1 FL=1
MEEMRSHLDEEILRLLESLKKLDPGSERYQDVAAQLVKLYDKELELEKLKIDYDDKWEQRELDSQHHVESLESKKLDRLVQVGTTVLQAAVTVGGLIFYGKCFDKGLEFEKTGTFSASMNKGLLQSLRPKK